MCSSDLLAQVMNLAVDGDCTAVLRERNIAPRAGWNAERCAVVDDLCVVAARALKLEVEDPDDPASYWEALREYGLPVDTVLPPRAPRVPSPVLLESEAREFLTRGLAARTYSPR